MNPLLHATLTLDTFGAEVFEQVRGTPVLIVSNHSSHLDAPMLLCALPGRVRSRTAVTAAADYFFDSVWRGASSALAFATVPIDRSGGAPSATPLNLLRDGWNLVIFPEGTRSKDGARGRFRLGAAYLAINAGVPVVPVGVRGAFAAMPRGRNWPVPGRPQVTVRFGRPLRAAPGEDVRSFTARLAAEVDRLCAEDATSWWESTRAGDVPTVASDPADVSDVSDGCGGAGEAGAGAQSVDAPQQRAGEVAPGGSPADPAGAGGPPAAGSASDPARAVAGSGTAAGCGALADAGAAAGAGAAGGSATAGGRALDRQGPRLLARPAAAGAAGGPVSVSPRLRGAPGTPTARWRRIWAATEPLPRHTSRSPWRR